jgi:hypothetical protein
MAILYNSRSTQGVAPIIPGAIMYIRYSSMLNALSPMIILLSFSTFAHAKSDKFHSAYFDMALPTKLKVITKTEQKNDGFYQYIFGSSNGDDAAMQIRAIVSSKSPDKGQSIEEFQTSAVANMSIMFIESYGLYQYLDTPENKKILGNKPSKFNIADTTFSGMTMNFGNIDAAFLVTNYHSMTYAFTLISRNSNQQTRKDNLKLLMNQLQTIKFN